MEQIAQEGAIQIFREVGGGMEEVVVGVVGVLQLEVLEYRLNTEYNVEIRMQQLPFEQLRWVQNDPDTYNLRDLDLTSDTKAVEDMKGNRLLLFTSDWAVRWSGPDPAGCRCRDRSATSAAAQRAAAEIGRAHV